MIGFVTSEHFTGHFVVGAYSNPLGLAVTYVEHIREHQ